MSEPFNKLTHVFSQKDLSDFKRIESEIERDQAAFLRVADNLIEVRDRKLYGIMTDSFEEYIRIRWGWTKQRAYQIISAKAVVDSLPPNSQILVDSETKARALAPVPPKQRPRVIADAVESSNGRPTARDIEEAAERAAPPPQKPAAQEILLDSTGWPVPEPLVKLFDRTDEVKGYLKQLSAMRGMLKRMQDNNDPLWKPVDYSHVGLKIDEVYAQMALAIPYAVCPCCQGREDTRANCNACHKRGVISKFLYERMPEELRKVREKSCRK